MKKYLLSFCIMLVALSLKAQSITLTFNGEGASQTIDSIVINNLSTGKRAKVTSKTVVLVQGDLGIEGTRNRQSFSIFPNPFSNYTSFTFATSQIEPIKVTVTSITGQVVAQVNQTLGVGTHLFKFYSPVQGQYIVSVLKRDGIYSQLVTSMCSSASGFGVEYVGEISTSVPTQNVKKNTKKFGDIGYTPGDKIRFDCYSNSIKTEIIDTPTVAKEYQTVFVKNPDYVQELLTVISKDYNQETESYEILKMNYENGVFVNATLMDNTVVSMESTRCTFGHITTSTKSYEYDENGKISKEIYNFADGCICRFEYTLKEGTIVGRKQVDRAYDYPIDQWSTNIWLFTPSYLVNYLNLNFIGYPIDTKYANKYLTQRWHTDEPTYEGHKYRYTFDNQGRILSLNAEAIGDRPISCFYLYNTGDKVSLYQLGLQANVNEIYLGFSIPQNMLSTISEAGVCSSTNAEPTIADTKLVFENKAGLQYNSIKNLTENTKYYVRTYTINSDNSIVYGSVQEISTVTVIN